VRVPDEFAKAADVEIVVRLQTAATGKLEASQKLKEIKEGPAGTSR
jgi:hypothetical protein